MTTGRFACSIAAMRVASVIFTLALIVATAAPAARPDAPITWDHPTTGPSGPRGGLQLPDGRILGVRHVTRGAERLFVCTRSDDAGRTWADHGTIARDTVETDLGDGHLLRFPDGRLWCSLRRNRVPRTYAIEISESTDDGASWRKHSVVATSIVEPDAARPPRHTRGLWASFLFRRADGATQCYFDDERTPLEHGLDGHQWVTMRTWDERHRAWVRPVVVSRAPGNALSRDGMPSVVELPGGRLLATVESVGARRPHPNLVRSVSSDDGGSTWSWPDRGIVYRPRGNFMALAPWTIRTRGGPLICVFCTDEDRDTPDVSGTPPRRLNMDVKYVVSRDEGATWSATAHAVYDEHHRNYLPGIIELAADGGVLVQWANYATGGYMTRRGTLNVDR